MQIQNAEAKAKTRIVACRVSRQVCDLSQHYHCKHTLGLSMN